MTKRRKDTTTGSRLLEKHINTAFGSLGFARCKGLAEFHRVQRAGVGCVIADFPHSTLWGTRGRKEAMVLAERNPSGQLLPSDDGLFRCVIEAKYQKGSGSVLEKVAYVWLACQQSTVPNWLFLYGGKYWENATASAAVTWLQCQAGMFLPDDTRLFVCSLEEFPDFVRKVWGP